MKDLQRICVAIHTCYIYRGFIIHNTVMLNHSAGELFLRWPQQGAEQPLGCAEATVL